MTNQPFDYRTHLIDCYDHLQCLINELYAHGMTIGLKNELADMFKVFKDGDEVPGDLNYLRALKSPVVGSFVEMIETLFKMQSSLLNINAISEEELDSAEDADMEELDEEPPDLYKSPYFRAEMCVHEEVQYAFILTWQLANQNPEVPDEIYYQFDDCFYENELELPSDDVNVQLLLTGLNEILKINRLIDYYADDDNGSALKLES